MPLSTIKIANLIESATDKYIVKSKYADLRESCLIPQSVPLVVAEVKKELLSHFENEKQASEAAIISKACEKQKREDYNQATQDAQEEQEDSTLSSQIKIELTELQNKVSSEQTIREEEQAILRLQNKIKAIDEQLATAFKQQKPSHSDKNDSTQHHQAEKSLEELKNVTLSELDALQIKQLNSKEQFSRINEINNILNNKLPAKEKRRKERSSARKERENARSRQELDLNQLSEINRHLLKTSIMNYHNNLQIKYSELEHEATIKSYPIYLYRLEIFLPHKSDLKHPENEALKQIITIMNKYLQFKSNEEKNNVHLNNVQTDINSLKRELNWKEDQLMQFKNSNPELQSINSKFIDNSKKLTHSIEERSYSRSRLLKIWSPIAFFGSGISVASAFLALHLVPIIASFIPFLFIPAGVGVVILLAIFTAALVYTIKNSKDANQFKQNQAAIKANETRIYTQTGTLRQEIYSLKINISDLTKIIPELTKRIDVLNVQAKQMLTKAQMVNTTNASNQTFFEGAPPSYTDLTINPSSAPKKEKEEAGKTVLFNN